MPKLETAYQGLLSTQKQDAATAKAIAKVQDEQAKVDIVHDCNLRGTFYNLV